MTRCTRVALMTHSLSQSLANPSKRTQLSAFQSTCVDLINQCPLNLELPSEPCDSQSAISKFTDAIVNDLIITDPMHSFASELPEGSLLFKDLNSNLQSLQSNARIHPVPPARRLHHNYLVQKSLDTSNNSLLAGQELLLSLSFFDPRKKTPMAEFLVLGSQKLSDLRDAFVCQSDKIMLTGEHDQISQMRYTSSYFFFERTFYIDARDHQSRDYSV